MTSNDTQENTALNNKVSEFKALFSGKFSGVLRWPQLDELWAVVKNSEERWYIYAVGEEPPVKSSSIKDTITFIDEIDGLLRREHDEDYCGIVYANDLNKPTLIKIFDPSTLGTSCSIASQGPLPGWILSKMKPVDLKTQLKQTGSRRRWWQRLFIK